MLKPLVNPPVHQPPSAKTFSIAAYWFTTR